MQVYFVQMCNENNKFMKKLSSKKNIRSPRGSSTIPPLTLALTVTLTMMMGPVKTLLNMKQILL